MASLSDFKVAAVIGRINLQNREQPKNFFANTWTGDFVWGGVMAGLGCFFLRDEGGPQCRNNQVTRTPQSSKARTVKQPLLGGTIPF